MKRSLLLIAVILVVALSVSTAWGDAQLRFSPPSQTVPLSSTPSVTVYADKPGGQGIGDFNFNISWDPAILSFKTGSFAFDSLVDGIFNIEDFTPSSGNLYVEYISFDDPMDIVAIQGGLSTVPLFTFSFNTLATGTSALSFVTPGPPSIPLGDENGVQLSNLTTSDGAITVTGSQVPEPTTLLLMGTGLLAVFRRRK